MPPFRSRFRRYNNPYRKRGYSARRKWRKVNKHTLFNPTMKHKVRGLSKEIYHDRHICHSTAVAPTAGTLVNNYSDYWDLNYPYDPDTTLGGETAWNFLTMARKFQTFEVRATKLSVTVTFAPFHFSATTLAAGDGIAARKCGWLMIGYWSQDEDGTNNQPGWYTDFENAVNWAGGGGAGTIERLTERYEMVEGYRRQFICIPWEQVNRQRKYKFKRYVDFQKEFGWDEGDDMRLGGVEWSGSMTTTIIHPDQVARVGCIVKCANAVDIADFTVDVHIKHYTHWTRPNLSYNMELGFNIAP